MDLKRYEFMKKELEKLRAERARAEGALEQTMERIREISGCTTIEDARKHRDGLTDKIEAMENQWEESFGKFKALWDKARNAS